MILLDIGAPRAVASSRKGATHIHSLLFCLGYDRAGRYAVGCCERRCPPSKFGMICHVVAPKRFGELRRLGQPRSLHVRYHMEHRDAIVQCAT